MVEMNADTNARMSQGIEITPGLIILIVVPDAITIGGRLWV